MPFSLIKEKVEHTKFLFYRDLTTFSVDLDKRVPIIMWIKGLSFPRDLVFPPLTELRLYSVPVAQNLDTMYCPIQEKH